MQPGQYQLEIFLSLIVILGAALVALICDLLKGNNEQLRELALELKVRREEEHKRFQMLIPQALAAPCAAPAAPRAPAPRAMATPAERRRSTAPDALAAMERGAQLAGPPRRRPRPEAAPAAQAKPARDWDELLKKAAAKDAGANVAQAPAAGGESPAIQAEPALPVGLQADKALPLVFQSEPALPAGFQAEPDLPAGFQDGYVLTRLVERRQPVSGLVISIGVNVPRNPDGSMPESVCTLIHSLLGPGDFAAQAREEEFLLIFPGERGASAQRRLSRIAQQLWDFQLRSTGTFSILFSWGGLEVRSESIDEAIASATERMQETRRGRRVLEMEPPESGLRRAV